MAISNLISQFSHLNQAITYLMTPYLISHMRIIAFDYGTKRIGIAGYRSIADHSYRAGYDTPNSHYRLLKEIPANRTG